MAIPSITRPGLKNRDTYNELLYQVAAWSPLQHPRPDALYIACKNLAHITRNSRLGDYATILKQFLLLKAGRPYRLSKEEYLGDLQKLAESNRTDLPAAARWILARSNAADIAFTNSPLEQYNLLESAARLISSIAAPVHYELPVLLPGIRSELGAEKLKGDLLATADPKTTTLPVPYRYFVIYLVNQAGPAFNCPPGRSLRLLDQAKTYCALSKKEHGDDQPFVSTNIDISHNVIETMRINLGQRRISKTVAIDRFGRLIQRIEQDIHNNLLPATKGLEWLATCHAGLAILSKDDESNRLRYIHRLHTLAGQVAQNRQGHTDFFSIDGVYRLAQPDKDEATAFRECIRYQPPEPTPDDKSRSKYKTNFYQVNIIKVGDTIITGNQSPVINRSEVSGGIVNTAGTQSNELAQALSVIETLAVHSGSAAVTAQYQMLADEAKKAKPDKSLLKSAWEGLTKLLPVLATMSDIADKITKLWHP